MDDWNEFYIAVGVLGAICFIFLIAIIVIGFFVKHLNGQIKDLKHTIYVNLSKGAPGASSQYNQPNVIPRVNHDGEISGGLSQRMNQVYGNNPMQNETNMREQEPWHKQQQQLPPQQKQQKPQAPNRDPWKNSQPPRNPSIDMEPQWPGQVRSNGNQDPWQNKNPMSQSGHGMQNPSSSKFGNYDNY